MQSVNSTVGVQALDTANDLEILRNMAHADQLIYRLRQLDQSDALPIDHFRELAQTLYRISSRDFHREAFLGITQIRHGQDAIVRTLMRDVIKDKIFTIFDIGANDGWFLKRVMEHPRLHALVAFEPIPYLCSDLETFTKDRNNVEIHNLAVGATTESQSLNIYRGVDGLSSLLDFSADYHFLGSWFNDQDKEIISVNTVKLDDFFSGWHLRDSTQNIALKIDVQGYEWNVLQGAKQILQSGLVKAILIELMTKEKYAGSKTMLPVLNFLSEFNFEVFDIHPFYREREMVFQECHQGRLTEFDCLLVHKDILAQE